MNKIINFENPELKQLFHGAISLDMNESGIQPWRLPFQDKYLFTESSGVLLNRAQSTSGVKLRFYTDSPFIRLNYDLIFTDLPDSLDFALVKDNEITDIITAPKKSGYVVFEIKESGIYEIWLHPMYGFRIQSMEIEDGSVLSADEDNRLKWVVYGSSITMGRQATNGASTWPGTAARKMDLNLTSLGFAGECHIDPLISDVIISQNPDLVTLKLGINIYGSGSLNMRSFRLAVIALIYRLRQYRKDLPISLISPIFSCEREDMLNNSGMTLKDYRSELEAVFETFIQRGDKYLSYTHGYELLGPEEADLLPDDLHPGPEGYELMGIRASEKVLPKLMEMNRGKS